MEVGATTIYVIEVRNEGTSPITGIELENILDCKMQFVAAEGPGTYKVQGERVIFVPLERLEPGDKATYRIRCKAIEPGAAKNTVSCSHDQFEQPILDEEGTSIYR